MDERLGLIERVLAFIDRPWKAATVIALIIIVGTGWAAWDYRAQIAEAILRHDVHPVLRIKRFKEVAIKLMAETNADAVMLVRGDMNANSARNLEGYDRDQRPWLAMTGSRPIFTQGANIELIVRFLSNETVCYDVTDGGPEVQSEARLGIQRACMASIPPLPNLLVGALWLGWKTPLKVADEAHAQALMHTAANSLASW